MSTHEAIAPDRGRWIIIDDAGRGEFYISMFEAGEEIVQPRLARTDELAELQGERLMVAEVLQQRNVALSCARRAERIVAAGRLDVYKDITPIYVRLAEAEVKLRQK
jgi:tRNA A37 threonylcarbamoyladenosine modification protein TsaB